MDPVIPYRLIPAIDLMVTPAGEMVVDFGQVMAGRARIHVDVPQGQQVVLNILRHWMKMKIILIPCLHHRKIPWYRMADR